MRSDSLRRAAAWSQAATFSERDFSVERLTELLGDHSVSVVIPALNEAGTVGSVVSSLEALRAAGVAGQVLVVDGGSTDDTAQIALAAGAEIARDDQLLPGFEPPIGKGDAMWRSLAVVTGDIVCFVDADSGDFDDRFVRGLIGPLLLNDDLVLVKGAFERPFVEGGRSIAGGGGRVNELMARPLLNLFFPELSELAQPLAGELAARRQVLEAVPFATGYGVEIEMLIEVYKRYGLDAIAQSDLGQRINAHQPLKELGKMAYTILRVGLEQAGATDLDLTSEQFDVYRMAGGEDRDATVKLRPPFAEFALSREKQTS